MEMKHCMTGKVDIALKEKENLHAMEMRHCMTGKVALHDKKSRHCMTGKVNIA